MGLSGLSLCKYMSLLHETMVDACHTVCTYVCSALVGPDNIRCTVNWLTAFCETKWSETKRNKMKIFSLRNENLQFAK